MDSGRILRLFLISASTASFVLTAACSKSHTPSAPPTQPERKAVSIPATATETPDTAGVPADDKISKDDLTKKDAPKLNPARVEQNGPARVEIINAGKAPAQKTKNEKPAPEERIERKKASAEKEFKSPATESSASALKPVKITALPVIPKMKFMATEKLINIQLKPGQPIATTQAPVAKINSSGAIKPVESKPTIESRSASEILASKEQLKPVVIHSPELEKLVNQKAAVVLETRGKGTAKTANAKPVVKTSAFAAKSQEEKALSKKLVDIPVQIGVGLVPGALAPQQMNSQSALGFYPAYLGISGKDSTGLYSPDFANGDSDKINDPNRVMLYSAAGADNSLMARLRSQVDQEDANIKQADRQFAESIESVSYSVQNFKATAVIQMRGQDRSNVISGFMSEGRGSNLKSATSKLTASLTCLDVGLRSCTAALVTLHSEGRTAYAIVRSTPVYLILDLARQPKTSNNSYNDLVKSLLNDTQERTLNTSEVVYGKSTYELVIDLERKSAGGTVNEAIQISGALEKSPKSNFAYRPAGFKSQITTSSAAKSSDPLLNSVSSITLHENDGHGDLSFYVSVRPTVQKPDNGQQFQLTVVRMHSPLVAN